MERLRAHYDFVVIDSAPSLVVADGLALAPMVDGVLFVAHAENTHRGAVSAARNQLEQVGANIFGAVLNDFDPSKAKSSPYYYRYGYKYAYQYAAPPEKNGGTTSEEPRRIGRNRS
jgi:receptor protein-tyrosine kinase